MQNRKGMVNWLNAADKKFNIRMALIEDVHSIFGVSAKANFQFGRSVERAHFALSLHSYGLDLVQPKIWQKEVGVRLPAKKKKAILKEGEPKPKKVNNSLIIKKQVADICKRLYPTCVIYTPRGRLLDGRSDALCIAHYCMTKYKV